jgi:hypothetical protein
VIFYDGDGRPFVLDGPEELVLVSECHELPVVAEPPLTDLYIHARGGDARLLAVCPRCGAYQEREDGENYPADERPTATLADVREAIRRSEA